MNPAPCIAIECASAVLYQGRYLDGMFRTRAQILKGLLRVWRPGEADYFLWIPQCIYWPGKSRYCGARWWQPPTG